MTVLKNACTVGSARVYKEEKNCTHWSAKNATASSRNSARVGCIVFFFQAEDGIRDLVRSRGLGDVYKRQRPGCVGIMLWRNRFLLR